MNIRNLLRYDDKMNWRPAFLGNLSRNCLVFLTLSACGAPGAFQESLMQVEAGMTTAQVEAVLGPPDNRQFSGKRMGWTYQFYHTSAQMMSEWYDHYVILFDDGVVYSLYNYPDKSFRQIDFRDDPARRGETIIRIKEPHVPLLSD